MRWMGGLDFERSEGPERTLDGWIMDAGIEGI